MPTFRSPMPDFDNPPVGEVALSVQFERLAALQVAHFGLLWELLRGPFPKTQSHAPLDPVFEVLTPKRGTAPGVRLEIRDEPMPPRVWFLNETETEIIQVQRDRFVFNWRRVKPEDKYPRFGYVRSRFIECLNVFLAFLSNQDLGQLLPNQCEVTYVNQIETGTAWGHHNELGQILRPWDSSFDDSELPECELVRLQLQYFIEDDRRESENRVGRLHVDVQPARRVVDNEPIFVMNLTARGIPLAKGLDGAVEFFDLGHETIVRAFRAVTTDVMHKEWGYRG